VHTDPPPLPEPVKPAKVRVKLVTHPPDAIVTLDGKKFGKTPLDETIDSDPGKHVLRLKHRGYRWKDLDVTLDGDVIEDIALVPR
jgi:hypothetical protein